MPQIYEVTQAAFKRISYSNQKEHLIVDALRGAGTLDLSLVATNFAQKQGNTIEEMTEIQSFHYTINEAKAYNPSALMGEGLAQFALQHGRNRSARSPCEHSQSVPVRATCARKPSQSPRRLGVVTFACPEQVGDGSKVTRQNH